MLDDFGIISCLSSTIDDADAGVCEIATDGDIHTASIISTFKNFSITFTILDSAKL